MAEDGNTRDEVVRLTQLLVVEGTKFMAAFAALHRLHHTDAEALTRVLIAQEQGTPVTAGALAEELGLTTGAITGVVDRLERAGHLSRVRDERDRRKVLLQYSSGGRALADEFFIPVKQRTEVVMDHFSPTELEVVRRYLAATGAAVAAHREVLAAQSPKP
jgi:DNA-binding MarR family transcriptional regulator